MASIFTSRGCSFDCNFCAIWEFYERRTRFLSAEKIVDQMEACEEPFVFVLDDNFLTSKRRAIRALRRARAARREEVLDDAGPHRLRGRHPGAHGAAREERAGHGALSGYESNDDDNLAALRKKNTWEKNKRANEILREIGIFSTGIFMVRAGLDAASSSSSSTTTCDRSRSAMPLVTILTPLPGTQLYRAYKDQLLTTDHRLFDLLHAVLPTRLPRAEFYDEFARFYDGDRGLGARRVSLMLLKKRPAVRRESCRAWPGSTRAPGATSASTAIPLVPARRGGAAQRPRRARRPHYQDVTYPTAHEPSREPAASSRAGSGQLVRLRNPHRTWADDVPPSEPHGAGSASESARHANFSALCARRSSAIPAVNHLFLNRLATSPFSRQDYRVFGENHYPLVCVVHAATSSGCSCARPTATPSSGSPRCWSTNTARAREGKDHADALRATSSRRAAAHAARDEPSARARAGAPLHRRAPPHRQRGAVPGGARRGRAGPRVGDPQDVRGGHPRAPARGLRGAARSPTSRCTSAQDVDHGALARGGARRLRDDAGGAGADPARRAAQPRGARTVLERRAARGRALPPAARDPSGRRDAALAPPRARCSRRGTAPCPPRRSSSVWSRRDRLRPTLGELRAGKKLAG